MNSHRLRGEVYDSTHAAGKQPLEPAVPSEASSVPLLVMEKVPFLSAPHHINFSSNP
jgi:hypothetical protein